MFLSLSLLQLFISIPFTVESLIEPAPKQICHHHPPQMPYNGMLPFFPPNLLLHNSHDEDDETHHLRGMEMAAAALGKRAVSSFSGMEAAGCEEVNEENASDGGGGGQLQVAGGERKKKLSLDQARVLEKNFEMGSKLEPERKMELARTLGLQPRQIAIWFQNRRARWKTKQLEKEYDELKRNFEITRRENDALQAQNKKLLSQLLALKGKETLEHINLNKETEGSCSMRSDNSSDINLDISRASINDNNNNTSNHNMLPFYKTPVSSHHLLPQLVPHNHSNSSSSISRKEEGSRNQSNNSLCNIFCSSSDEQSAFWAWSEQQQQQHNNKFHHH